MELTKLVEQLARLGVNVSTSNGQLTLSASKGVITEQLRSQILQNKAGLIGLLEKEAAQQVDDVNALRSDPTGDDKPFALNDLQLGFYVANDPHMEFHVRPHAYMENDRVGLDVAQYERAWNRALLRHRRELCVVNVDVELVRIKDVPTVRCRVHDLRALSEAEVSARLSEIREAMMRQELPLDTWPWLDICVSLWRHDGVEHQRIHYNHNNFFIDGLGTSHLLAEIDDYYENPTVDRPPLSISYRDAVLGLERLAESTLGQNAKEYWLSRLPQLPPPPALPMLTGLNRRTRSKLSRREGALDKQSWEALKLHASKHGLTPSSALLAAYALVLATWSNSDHFIVSQMVTRRFVELHPEIMHVLGNFASLYPLEIKLNSKESFSENAMRIQLQVTSDMRHFYYGGMRVLQQLNRLQGSFGSAPSPFVVGSGLFMKSYKKADFTVLETSQTVLDYQFFELEDGSLFFVWDLLEEFFPAGLVDAMMGAFQRLIVALTRGAEIWQCARIDLVNESELSARRAQNATQVPVSNSLLCTPLSLHARVNGRFPVLVNHAGVLTYEELDDWSSSIAVRLLSTHVKAGSLVAVLMDRGQELLAAVAAVTKAGAAYVPIDPALPTERVSVLLCDTGAQVVLTVDKYRQSIPWPCGVTPIVIPDWRACKNTSGLLRDEICNADLAYVIYTSGSTGRPKGVMISHEGAVNTIEDVNRRFNVNATDRVFGVSAFNFDLSVYDIFGTIAAGACLVYPDPESALDPAHCLEWLLKEKVTIWNSVPALMSLVAEVASRRTTTLPDLRLVMLSGDKIPLDLPQLIRSVAPNAEIVSLGGATESSIWSIFYPIREVEPNWTTIPYGYPMSNQHWEIRDRHGAPCPIWVPGDLFIGGIGLARGYWNDADKTAQSFIVDPASGGRLYRTGDIGRYLPDGCIEWIGRADFQVKIHGHRIELGEIESVLGEHPMVRQAVITAQNSSDRRVRLVAHVCPSSDPAAGLLDPTSVVQLETFLKLKLPDYMVPTAWRIVEQFPLTSNGKVDRKALSETEAVRRPREPSELAFVPPASDVEKRLQSVWQACLRIPKIGVTDDFFDLGGQSFDAIRIFAAIKETYGPSFTLSQIWRHRTIRGLADLLVTGSRTETSKLIVPIKSQGRGTPLFLVHPAGGSVMKYGILGRYLERPIFGIQAQPDQSGLRSNSIETVAARYIEEVRAVQPSGPYSIGGWSSGAMIAFAMAAQLLALGETVERVYILDGPTPRHTPQLSKDTLMRWFILDSGIDAAVDKLREESFVGMTSREQVIKAAGCLGILEDPSFDVDQMVATFDVFCDMLDICSRYKPKRINADLTVVRVDNNVVEEFSAHPDSDAPDWGWRKFSDGDVRSVTVSGTHHTFLSEPGVRELCAHLR